MILQRAKILGANMTLDIPIVSQIAMLVKALLSAGWKIEQSHHLWTGVTIIAIC